MQLSLILLAIFGLTLYVDTAELRNNVVYRKINDVTTTRSTWTVTMVIDLDPYTALLNKLAKSIKETRSTIVHVIARNPPGRSAIVNDFRSLMTELSTLEKTQFELLERFLEYHSLKPRTKRSLLPFIGKAFSFLFGTVSDADLGAIKRNVKRLSATQEGLKHVVRESLSILNVSRVRISENRQTINELEASLGQLDNQVQEVTAQLDNRLQTVEFMLPTYLQLDGIVEELKHFIQNAFMSLEHLQLQLNMLTIGKLSPSIISPESLGTLLLDIQSRIPTPLKLPGDPKANLWHFYKLLTCSTVIDETRILVIVPIPLLDTHNDLEVFKVHNLPIPFNVSVEKLPGMVAQYHLEAEAIAINKERTSFALLNAHELEGCSKPMLGFCSIKSPVYPVSLNQFCIVALFMKDQEGVNASCKTMVNVNTVLPMAEYLTGGHWVISTAERLTFSIVCEDDKNRNFIDLRENRGGEVVVEPPLGIIQLRMTCSATNEHLKLLTYFQEESRYEISDSLRELLTNFRRQNVTLWDPFHKSLPQWKRIAVPARLSPISPIPMDKLISELKSETELENMDTSYPVWLYAVIVTPLVVVALLGIMYKCKRNKGSVKWFGGQRRFGGTAVPSELPMVSVSTAADDYQSGGAVPSAPSFQPRDEEPMEVDNEDKGTASPYPLARLLGGGHTSA